MRVQVSTALAGGFDDSSRSRAAGESPETAIAAGASGQTRTYYIAVDELEWGSAPGRIELLRKSGPSTTSSVRGWRPGLCFTGPQGGGKHCIGGTPMTR